MESLLPPFLALPSLSLLPPHRPIKSIYSNILSSPTWVPRLAPLASLGEADGEHARGVGAHRVVRHAWGSTGCVNALDWEEGGEGRLASAGDDTKICIWKPGLDRVEEVAPEYTSPSLDYGLSETIDTGHRANIFSVKWAPHTPTRLFSCAGDSTVRVYDLSLATNPSLRSETVSSPGHPSWTHHEDATACTRVLRCHTDRVKRIATEGSPDVFLTCSEDGTVRQHDLRSSHTCRASGGGCGPPLVEYAGLSLYSLSISKLRPHLFVVAGTCAYAFLHDRRMIRQPMQRDWGVEMEEDAVTQCVRRFGVPKPEGQRGELTNHVVATKLSPTNARDLLVSYSGDAIYLFDTDADPAAAPTVRVVDKNASRSGKRARDDDEEEAETVESVGRNEREGEKEAEKDDEEPFIGPMEDDDVDGRSSSSTVVEEEEEETDEEEEPTNPFAHSRKTYNPTVPLVHPRHSYDGHLNSETVKDVNFAFNGSHVLSGSDDGNFFVWQKESEELVGIFEGDSSVVNVLQPHPRLPLLAISGIDPTVRLFGPTTSDLEKGNLLDKADEIIQRNKSGQSRRGLGADPMLAQALMRFLSARGATMVPGGEDGPSRIVLGGRREGEDGEGDEAECCIM